MIVDETGSHALVQGCLDEQNKDLMSVSTMF
jgi:hypothetical protein